MSPCHGLITDCDIDHGCPNRTKVSDTPGKAELARYSVRLGIARWNSLEGWFEPDNAAQGSRDADRSAPIRADGKRHEP